MKRILIAGANSYIGTSLEKWLSRYPGKYAVDTIDLTDGTWRSCSFSGYESLFHVAGIAHTKETAQNRHLYYQVNRDLAYETAQKAKREGVGQFIFLSSMSVYGIETGRINRDTRPNPTSHYGRSKLEAEHMLSSLAGESFHVAILRPPMVYGKECKGNYPRLARLALKCPFFPDIENRRSMIYIDNLCEFVRLLIDDNGYGLFFPQNDEYVCTAEMVSLIAKARGKTIRFVKIFNPLIRVLRLSIIHKLFGDLKYQKWISEYRQPYCVVDFEQSINNTENQG